MIKDKKRYGIFLLVASVILMLMMSMISFSALDTVSADPETDTDTWHTGVTTLYYIENGYDLESEYGDDASNYRATVATMELSASLKAEQIALRTENKLYVVWGGFTSGRICYHDDTKKDSIEEYVDIELMDLVYYKCVDTIVVKYKKDSTMSISNLPFPTIYNAEDDKEVKIFDEWLTPLEKKYDTISQLHNAESAMKENELSSGIVLKATYKEDPGGVITALQNFMLPLLIVIGTFGSLYCVVLGINMAKADSADAREQSKKRMVNALIGLVAIIILMMLLMLYAYNYDVVYDFITSLFSHTVIE